MKKYRVEFLGWYGGKFKDFWFKKNALKYIEQQKENQLWIDLTNNWTDEKERVKSTDTSKYYRTEDGQYLLIKKGEK